MQAKGCSAGRAAVWGRAAWLLCGWLALATPSAAQSPPQELREALRSQPGEAPRTVSLPDALKGGDATSILRPSYRLRVDLGPTPGRTAIYLPGVLAHARVAVNGHTVADRIREPLPRHPRGADRLLLASVPAEFLRPGTNEIEVALAAPRSTGVSRLWIGDEDTLRGRYDRKVLAVVTGPFIAAAVIMALSLCVLVLWARSPLDPLYGYFGIGGLLYALHSMWTVLPDPLLSPPHLSIWWTQGYGFFCAPLVVFCTRLGQWPLPRFERAMWLCVAAGPVVLYAAEAAGALETALVSWRLLWICTIAVGVVGVGRYVVQQRNLRAALVLAAGVVTLYFGVRDWVLDQTGSDNNPVFLTNFSGLQFFPLVAWILIDGFVQTSRKLQQLNVELERRVQGKSIELLKALEEMRVAKDAAEGANRAKSTFLAAASHDLRQPAHALGLYMAALRSERISAEQATLVDRMTTSVAALDTMFNALLDISRMDGGAVVVDATPFALGPLLHRLAEEFSREAADKGLRLSVRVSAQARHVRAFSDPLLLERIVRNLLGNAVKYTQAGGVLLACRLRGGAEGQWLVEVWDTGPGIPASEHERVFDEFVQLGRPERDPAGGLGLGLSIVRRLARLLGHPLRLESRIGRGSRFALELPATTEAPRNDATGIPIGTLEGLGVGVIDDDPDVRDAMRALLERWNCGVTIGASVDEVLAHAGDAVSERLQVLIVDYQLSDGKNGIDAIAAVRRACGANVPALVVSGTSAPEPLMEMQASAFEMMRKPVSAARLRSWLIQAAQAVQPKPAGAAAGSHREVGVRARELGPDQALRRTT